MSSSRTRARAWILENKGTRAEYEPFQKFTSRTRAFDNSAQFGSVTPLFVAMIPCRTCPCALGPSWSPDRTRLSHTLPQAVRLLHTLNIACSALSWPTLVATPRSLSRQEATIPYRDQDSSPTPRPAKLCHDIKHYCDTGPAEHCRDNEELCHDPVHQVWPQATLRHKQPCCDMSPTLSRTRTPCRACKLVVRT